MKNVLVFFCLLPVMAFAQLAKSPKSVIGEDVLSKWYWLDDLQASISPDGEYASWVIINRPYKSRTLILSSTDGSWRQEFLHDQGGFFSADSRYYLIPMKERIAMVMLGENKVRYIDNAEKLINNKEASWIAYRMKGTQNVVSELLSSGKSKQLGIMKNFMVDKSGKWIVGHPIEDSTALLLYNVSDDKELRYKGVQSYQLKDDGQVLVLLTSDGSNSKLQHIILPNGKVSQVHSTNNNERLVRYCLDSSGEQVSFIIQSKAKDQSVNHSIWSYRMGDHISHIVKDDTSMDIEGTLHISSLGVFDFTRDGRYIYFSLASTPDRRKAAPNAVRVDVWSYKDGTLYSAQESEKNPRNRMFHAIVATAGGRVTKLTRSVSERIADESGKIHIAADHALVVTKQQGDRFWEYKRDSVWLVSLKDGSRKLLPFYSIGWPNILEFDRKGEAVIGFDRSRGRHLFRYDIASGKEQKLSSGLPDWRLGIDNPFRTGWCEEKKWVNPVIAARTADGDRMLLYDNYDIWQIDLSGKTRAINLTNGFGNRHKITFRLALPDESVILASGSLILTALNEVNKFSGFYRTKLNADPDSLRMGKEFYFFSRKMVGSDLQDPYGTGMLPLKARDVNAWLVCRESSTEAPNYFFTKDFRSYKRLTDLQPQNEYNWYTTELVNFTQSDGVRSQGILYKPKDFDPKKKYPVIFHYYEQWSHTLNRFIRGAVSETGNPNIPWYVSRGYLVFRPDFYFERVYRGRSTLRGVEAAARELMKRPYIDSKRLGLMGLSQGGEFTNYIVTHSKLFAAAFEGCGYSDIVSAALRVEGVVGADNQNYKGVSALYRHEVHYRGSNIWLDKEQWIEESSILSADMVTTPLLIMHNKADGLPFGQAVEMFTALRRLNKRVWLLQYDDGGHGVNGKDALDLTRRMTQYFDHYLKGMPPPSWMTKGIPLALKGIETRFELDPEGNCGKACKICQQRKYR